MSPTRVNAMSVDVEDYFHVQAFADTINRKDWTALEYRAEQNTEALLSLFGQRGIRATFFVLGWVAERSPRLVRTIADGGHEVACHGWSHRLVYEQPREEFRSETERAKKLLEDTIGAEVSGYRAASYSITRQSLWALDALIDLGFRYDSSIYPVRHGTYGVPDAPTAPFRLQTPSGHAITEFPIATATWLGLRIPVGGGGYFRILPYALVRRGLQRINGPQRSPFVFYLHPWEIDPEQPVIEGLRALSRFRHYTNLHKTRERLERLLDEFCFGSVSDVLASEGLLYSGDGG